MKRQNESHNVYTVFCDERERLREAFLGAVRDLAELQRQQTEAVVQNDADFVRFDDLIHMARIAKDNAKYAFLAHLSVHRCEMDPQKEEDA